MSETTGYYIKQKRDENGNPSSPPVFQIFKDGNWQSDWPTREAAEAEIERLENEPSPPNRP